MWSLHEMPLHCSFLKAITMSSIYSSWLHITFTSVTISSTSTNSVISSSSYLWTSFPAGTIAWEGFCPDLSEHGCGQFLIMCPSSPQLKQVGTFRQTSSLHMPNTMITRKIIRRSPRIVTRRGGHDCLNLPGRDRRSNRSFSIGALKISKILGPM